MVFIDDSGFDNKSGVEKSPVDFFFDGRGGVGVKIKFDFRVFFSEFRDERGENSRAVGFRRTDGKASGEMIVPLADFRFRFFL